MAGVNFEKIKTAQSLKAQLRHCDTEMRRIDLQDERDKASKTLQEALEEKKRYKQASERLERQEMENKTAIAVGRRTQAESIQPTQRKARDLPYMDLG